MKNYTKPKKLLLLSVLCVLLWSIPGCMQDELEPQQSEDENTDVLIEKPIDNGRVARDNGINPAWADMAYRGFNSAFLTTSGGRTYYKRALNDNASDGTWTLALDIQGMMDVYERTGLPEHRTLVNNLVNGFLQLNPPPYDWDGWNDDIAWFGLVLARGHQMTGTSNYLTQARYCFDYIWSRGWDTQYNNGGIWEQQPDYTPEGGEIIKEALSNNPTGLLACMIYQSNGDQWYLDRAIQIYDWVWWHLFNAETGQVYRGIYPNGQVDQGTAVYNQGAFIDFANVLWKLTGNPNYLRDATRAASYVKNNMTSNGIISNGAGYLNTWAAEFARGLGHLCTDNPELWDTFGDWMVQNATSIWNNRRTDYNLTWNAWNQQTPNNGSMIPTQHVSAVAWLQFAPAKRPGITSGGTFSIISKASGKAVDVEAGSTSNGGNILQWTNYNQPNQRWVITEAATNAYRIRSAGSGLSLDLEGGNTANGTNVIQWGWNGGSNQMWYLVPDGQGYYSIVSVASGRALDVAGGSNENGANILQWNINDADNQKWSLVP
ncbi:RICIN domain-containing protein [Fulvivirga ligni]|uniref:RICIN domain-containing protein n=1 Tax=Fulvivirga ligni TaxID=2904246 RepID=UPI001F215F92|nr:RICIN domain-containing protein [Fulvivirga ligni]UII19621.1 RICIN domain-containing protein [Fulvivirga ligni]